MKRDHMHDSEDEDTEWWKQQRSRSQTAPISSGPSIKRFKPRDAYVMIALAGGSWLIAYVLIVLMKHVYIGCVVAALATGFSWAMFQIMSTILKE